MRVRGAWTIQSFLSCFLWNLALTALFYILAQNSIDALQKWIAPFSTPDPALPEDVRSAFVELGRFLDQTRRYAAPVLFGAGGVLTFMMWLFVLLQGFGLEKRVLRQADESREKSTHDDEARKPTAEKEFRPLGPPPKPAGVSPQAAVQILSIMQREGRLIDFLQEDLSGYQDAQIGAAVRNIHQGCKEALVRHVELQPVFDETEGGDVTVPPGFDAKAVRLTGNVSGSPPFKGVLRHRGWKALKVDLPGTAPEEPGEWIVAPAEVEIVGL